MSKLKIEHGVSRIKRAKLQASIEHSVLDDIELFAEWSNNESNYIITELLRFALTQDEDFQKFKSEHAAKHPSSNSTLTPVSSLPKTISDPSAKSAAGSMNSAERQQ